MVQGFCTTAYARRPRRTDGYGNGEHIVKLTQTAQARWKATICRCDDVVSNAVAML